MSHSDEMVFTVHMMKTKLHLGTIERYHERKFYSPDNYFQSAELGS